MKTGKQQVRIAPRKFINLEETALLAFLCHQRCHIEVSSSENDFSGGLNL